MPGRQNLLHVQLAADRKWAELYAQLDRSAAGVYDFDKDKKTALHWASEHGDVDVIDELVLRGANVYAIDNWGFTPLHWAAFKIQTDAAKRLVQHGADLNVKTKKGWTPIELVRYNGHTELAAWLELAQLKNARARNHWATARTFVKVYLYAFFWHAYVGEQLCAPGGKWAEHDRAAFEEEFRELRR